MHNGILRTGNADCAVLACRNGELVAEIAPPAREHNVDCQLVLADRRVGAVDHRLGAAPGQAAAQQHSQQQQRRGPLPGRRTTRRHVAEFIMRNYRPRNAIVRGTAVS